MSFYEDSIGVVKGNTSSCGKPIISCAIGLLIIVDFVILEQV
jgi:hypothetical protein